MQFSDLEPKEDSMPEQPLIYGVIKELASRHGFKKLWVFNAPSSDRQSPDSALDLLVDMETGHDFVDLIWFKEAVEEQLGIKIDVVTDGALGSGYRKSILKDTLPL